MQKLVKNWETNFLRQAFQEPIFLWLMQILKAVAMGRGCGDCIFFGQMSPTQP
jgi:hypothetical protein